MDSQFELFDAEVRRLPDIERIKARHAPAEAAPGARPGHRRLNRKLNQTLGTPSWIPDFADRFWSKVEKSDNCWRWRAGRSRGKRAYGLFSVNGVHLPAHCVALYLAGRGVVPPGLVVDHLCRNQSCVNPDHLEVVSPTQNAQRRLSSARPALAVLRREKFFERTEVSVEVALNACLERIEHQSKAMLLGKGIGASLALVEIVDLIVRAIKFELEVTGAISEQLEHDLRCAVAGRPAQIWRDIYAAEAGARCHSVDLEKLFLGPLREAGL